MSYASALDFITTATKNLTREKLDALGTPLVPAGTKFTTDAWGRRLTESRMEVLEAQDEDSALTDSKRIVAELGNLGIIYMINLAAVLEIVSPDTIPALMASFSEFFTSEDPSEEACNQVIKMKENGTIEQMEYSMNVEGLTTGSASIRLMAIVVARYFDLPCPVTDAEEIYAAVMAA